MATGTCVKLRLFAFLLHCFYQPVFNSPARRPPLHRAWLRLSTCVSRRCTMRRTCLSSSIQLSPYRQRATQGFSREPANFYMVSGLSPFTSRPSLFLQQSPRCPDANTSIAAVTPAVWGQEESRCTRCCSQGCHSSLCRRLRRRRCSRGITPGHTVRHT